MYFISCWLTIQYAIHNAIWRAVTTDPSLQIERITDMCALLFNHKQSVLPMVTNMEDSDLPAFISCSVVGVVLGDVGIYSIQRQLFIRGHGDSLDY